MMTRTGEPQVDMLMANLQRLHEENPTAFESFTTWIANPTHTQSVTLVFHGGRFSFARLETTSK